MNTFTEERRKALELYLATHELPVGLGDEEGACSIAAINLAISGELTDEIPACMSKVLGIATINLQDAMPHDMRNSDRYKLWLLTAAGTGRYKEQERLDVLLNWLFDTVLPQLQDIADKGGYGKQWRKMCEDRTPKAARAAYAADAADAARAAAYAADAADAADAARAAADAAAHAAAHADADLWETVDPIGVLERMSAV